MKNLRDFNHINLSQLQKFNEVHYVCVMGIGHSFW